MSIIFIACHEYERFSSKREKKESFFFCVPLLVSISHCFITVHTLIIHIALLCFDFSCICFPSFFITHKSQLLDDLLRWIMFLKEIFLLALLYNFVGWTKRTLANNLNGLTYRAPHHAANKYNENTENVYYFVVVRVHFGNCTLKLPI